MSAAKSIVIFWLLCPAAFASDAFLVVPNANATTPGVGEAIPQITNTNIRDQEIIGSDQFGSGAILINQIGYRALPGSGPATATIAALKVSLSTSAHSPNLSDPAAGFPVTANKRGTIEFDTPAGAQISVLGLSFTPPNNALTTIPALANVGPGGGSIAHLASGGDGWQTTFVLVNTGTSATSATLSFFNDPTGLPVSLPLAFPQTGGGTTMTVPTYTAQLAAGATLIVSSGVQPLITGSAQLSTAGHVSGFVIFRHNGQEAVVPLESRNASGYIIAFDNTSGTPKAISVDCRSLFFLRV